MPENKKGRCANISPHYYLSCGNPERKFTQINLRPVKE
jgi:hypothetical protein